ncbi:MAG: hypothetical protein QOJ11_566 [Frankiales bacterium]|jgi:hypothetical protein|nr:hypothetical protein [Frankiales bacterium]
MTVLIDTAGTAGAPAPADVAGWAAEQRVFISSVMADLRAERQGVADAVANFGAEPVWFEDFGGRDDDAQAAYLAEVASSTIYLGILDRAYGNLLPSRLSATHEEYREAEAIGLRVSVWVHAGEERQGDQLSFVNEVRQFHTTGNYTNTADLVARVTARLGKMAAEDLSPWCKLGNAIFRAHSVVDDGKTIAISATVTDAGVVSALEALRPGNWYGGQQEIQLTYAGRCLGVRVSAVTTRTTGSRATGIEMSLERDRGLPAQGLSMSFSADGVTYTADDITVFQLRKALFGERAPRGVLSIGGHIGDPLTELPDKPLPLELHRAVLGLLITEALVGSGRAARVTRLRVSPTGPRGRRVLVEWSGRDSRAALTERRSVDGYIVA